MPSLEQQRRAIRWSHDPPHPRERKLVSDSTAATCLLTQTTVRVWSRQNGTWNTEAKKKNQLEHEFAPPKNNYGHSQCAPMS
mmetsp:Transcript_11243/g.31169  ORF Transcript_11243/g.31169 Transcript_11243/m.31169 type:complete len:82 (-) Transcript_11243:981-1226(-)